jgi:hypothetical protein
MAASPRKNNFGPAAGTLLDRQANNPVLENRALERRFCHLASRQPPDILLAFQEDTTMDDGSRPYQGIFSVGF